MLQLMLASMKSFHRTLGTFIIHIRTSTFMCYPICCRGDVGMEMKPNTAYGPVSSSLPRPQVAAGSEDTYEAV